MKNIIISIQPEYCELIASGKKTIEVRKTAPKAPFRAFIYQTKKKWIYRLLEWLGLYQQKIIGEFICDKVICLTYETRTPIFHSYEGCRKLLTRRNGTLGIVGTTTEPFYNGKLSTIKGSCLEQKQLLSYGKGKILYGYHITALKIYDKPRELWEFYSIKQCKPEYSPFGYQWTWEDRHKRNTGGRKNKYRPVPIECNRCKSLVGGKDYLDEKSGCILFDYECASNYHKPINRPPQSWQYVETPDWAEEEEDER